MRPADLLRVTRDNGALLPCPVADRDDSMEAAVQEPAQRPGLLAADVYPYLPESFHGEGMYCRRGLSAGVGMLVRAYQAAVR